MILFALLAFASRASVGSANQIRDEYHEELFIKPLNGYVYTYFQFSTVWEVELGNDTFDHCHLFPRSLGELIQRHSVQELHVSMTKGLWRHETWGYPVKPAPPGAELWAWFKPETEKYANEYQHCLHVSVNENWKSLTGALSGLLCASLNFIDDTNTISPRLSLRPSGVVKADAPRPHLRYASLPREIVCTENLTPWKKLLPCNLKRGLSALLNSDHIYNTAYNSLGIHFRQICLGKDCESVGLELVQTVSLVYDLAIVGRFQTHWSVQRLFGQGLGKTCPLAKSSKILIDVTSNKTDNPFTLKPVNRFDVVESQRGGVVTTLAVLDMSRYSSNSLYNIEVEYSRKKMYPVNSPPFIYASRYITGYGQEFGGISTKIHNRFWQPVKAVLLENIPWFVPMYLHTLKVKHGDRDLKPLKLEYKPGKDRERPFYLEVLLELPARSVVTVSVDFDYAFLKWQEYPPDANHGFYMGSASITAFLPTARNYTAPPRDKTLLADSINASRIGYLIRVTTETLIITLPTPDFSMPYNVICLACTVVALAFGPLHNITTKRFVVLKSEKKGLLREFFSKLKRSLKKDSVESLAEEELDSSQEKSVTYEGECVSHEKGE